ncbi:MAG: DUF2635 domain-containing protein [Rickettsiales bacterium]|nr:DUF2635 domain-containing protein [Rickettsiales bacterium]|tara:strand:+ start:118 stop:291 length:174 start_codon:yes stop_codon:yes gene_type:complete
MKRLFIKPADGMVVRDPMTKEKLPVEGKETLINSYWQRRIKDGDVIVFKPSKSKGSK